MEGLPEKAPATQSSRKPSPFSPYHYSTCYRSSGRSRMFKLRFGRGLGSQAYARIPLFGDLSRVGLDCPFVLIPPILPLPHLRRRLCVCACIQLVMFALSLSPSLSHYYLSRSLYISLSSLRISPRMSLQKSRDRCKADGTLRTSRAIPAPQY